MAEKLKAPIAEPPEHDDYWSLARQPLHCLVFLLPLLGVYELGVLQLSGTANEAPRNGADYWMRTALQHAGLEHPHLLPAIVLGVLFAWQVAARHRWSVFPST